MKRATRSPEDVFSDDEDASRGPVPEDDGGEHKPSGTKPSRLLNLVLGFAVLFTWPVAAHFFYVWSVTIKPILGQRTWVRLLAYGSASFLLVSAAAMPRTNHAASLAARSVFLSICNWLGYKKWLTEPLSRAIVSFVLGSSRSLLIYAGLNLAVNTLPFNWHVQAGPYLGFLDKNRDGIVVAAEIEGWFFELSQRFLCATLSTLLGLCLLQVKRTPRTRVLEEEAFAAPTVASETSLPSLARMVFARQNPRDRRVRELARRLALIDRTLDFAIGFLLLVLPWIYLLGFRVQTVLAVGGVGGLAFGLATKNLVGNLVSGMLINLNRPFGEGDEVEGINLPHGIVEEIGLTATRINSDGVPAHVPNSLLLDGVVVNRTIKDFRSIRETVPVRLPDMRKLPELVAGVQRIVESHPKVLCKQDVVFLKRLKGGKVKLYPPQCVFSGYGQLGANIEITAFTRGVAADTFAHIKSDIMLKVNNFILDFGASVGFLGGSNPSHFIEASDDAA